MFTVASQLVLLVPFVFGLFIVMARVELYFSKRRNQMAYARYVAEMQSSGEGGCGGRVCRRLSV